MHTCPGGSAQMFNPQTSRTEQSVTTVQFILPKKMKLDTEWQVRFSPKTGIKPYLIAQSYI